MRVCLLVALMSLALAVRGEPTARAESPLVVRVEMREFGFRPATIRLPANRALKLVLVNRGQIAHQFDAPVLRRLPAVVYDASLHVETEGLDIVRLDPGGTATIEVYIPRRGRYPFACTIEGHKEAGMTGVIDVR